MNYIAKPYVDEWISAMALAGYEIRLSYNDKAASLPWTCHTIRNGVEEAWSRGDHGESIVQAIAKAFQAVKGEVPA